VQRDALCLERARIQRLGIVNQRQLALWDQRLNQLLIVLLGIIEAGDVGDVLDANTSQLFSERLAVIDNVMCPEVGNPLLALRA